MRAGEKGSRSRAASVSGIRRTYQASTTSVAPAMTPKISRHDPSRSTPPPSVGASTGAIMNTIDDRLITLAIGRPE